MPLYNVVILFNKNYTNWNLHFVQVALQHLHPYLIYIR
jgi:hypothetical protein